MLSIFVKDDYSQTFTFPHASFQNMVSIEKVVIFVVEDVEGPRSAFDDALEIVLHIRERKVHQRIQGPGLEQTHN